MINKLKIAMFVVIILGGIALIGALGNATAR